MFDDASETAADAPRAPRRRMPRSALVGKAAVLGALAAIASSRVFSFERLPAARHSVRAPAPVTPVILTPVEPPAPPSPVASAPPAPAPAPPASTAVAPRPLPRDPVTWLRQSTTESGLRVIGLTSEARATTFPMPSGSSFTLWECSLRLTAEGGREETRALVARLGTAPCATHVPDLDLAWLPNGRVRVTATVVLLGTRPDATAQRGGVGI